MKFLKLKTSWSNAELGLIKLVSTCFGVILGTYFSAFFKDYLSIVFLVLIVNGLFAGALWKKKMKK